MKTVKKKSALFVSIGIFFSISMHAQYPQNPLLTKEEMRTQIKELNERIKTATTHKARIQRERDILLEQFKKLSLSKK
jgi:hypothetical protein